MFSNGKRSVLDLSAIAGLVLLAVCAPASRALRTDGGGRIPDSDRVDLSTAVGSELTFQTLMDGLYLGTEDGTALLVEAPDAAAGPDASVEVVTSPESSVEVTLLSPRRSLRIGVRTPDSVQITLEARDSSGRLVASETASGPGRMDLVVGADDAVIANATLVAPGATSALRIGQLEAWPPHESAEDVEDLRRVLRSDTTQEVKVATLMRLERSPSREASRLLAETATGDYDAYVRERAVMAMAVVPDPSALPLLRRLERDDGVPPALRMAAHNTAWTLRTMFPYRNAPTLRIDARGTFRPGDAFEVAVTAVFDNDEPESLVFIRPGALIEAEERLASTLHRGPARAGQVIEGRRTFLARAPGRSIVWAVAHVSTVDGEVLDFEVPLYIEIAPQGGRASVVPPADIAQPQIHSLSASGIDR